MNKMDQEVVIAVLDEIVRTVILLCDSSEGKLTINLDENGQRRKSVVLRNYCQDNEEKDEECSDKRDIDLNVDTNVTSNSKNINKDGSGKSLAENDRESNAESLSTSDDERLSAPLIKTIETNNTERNGVRMSERCLSNSEDRVCISESGEYTENHLNNSDGSRVSDNLEAVSDNLEAVFDNLEAVFDNLEAVELNDTKCLAESNKNHISKAENRETSDTEILGNLRDSSTSNILTETHLESDSSITQEDKRLKFPLTELKRSPRIYGRKVRQIEDTAIPSTSTSIVPSVIVVNDFSNGSSSSAYSTGEMRRRTVESSFAFLSDSDLSDEEINEQSFGYQNRAFESFEEIEIRNEDTEIIPVEECETIKNSNYFWNSMGLLKVAQMICCITMYVSIGLCRFHSKYIQIFCIVGACISAFLLIVYSYRIQIDHWRAYTIRLLLSEYVYLVMYTASDTVFAIIKFEFDEETNYRERMAVMILMISTALAASTYCYDAILCYSLIKEAGKNNPEEKKLLLSYLPTCSKSSRAEICDIFHTCIL